MSDLVDKLVCENLKTLKPYESARRLFSGGQHWLNANESPFANEYELSSDVLNRYPDCQPETVIGAYAAYAGVEKSQTLTTRGADEGIELLIRAFCEPGQDAILQCLPTYGMYAISAETCNVGVVNVPLKSDFTLDIDGILAQKGKVKLIFLCAPNNPTGTTLAREQITTILDAFADSALVVVDEAYIEFDMDNTWAPAISDYPNLVVLRTLSKAFALAGIRCGFTLANEPVIKALLKVIAPYPVPAPVAQIAEQALSEDSAATLRGQIAELNTQKAWLVSELRKISDVEIVGDTRANFILFRYPLKQALMDYLVAQGMLIRDQSKQLSLENCLRISIGNEQQNRLFISLFEAFIQTLEQDS